MIIDHNLRYVYTANPKTGTSSVHDAIARLPRGQHHPEPEIHHRTMTELLRDHPEIADYFKFGFVRNPWSKMVSIYHDFTLRRKNQYSRLKQFDRPLLSEFSDFHDFCIRLRETPWTKNVFFRPQLDFVTVDGKLIDFVGRFENLTADLDRACGMVGIHRRGLGHYNVAPYQNRDYRAHYNDASRIAVAELYALDIEAFEYAF